jgi:hypothetical protein
MDTLNPSPARPAGSFIAWQVCYSGHDRDNALATAQAYEKRGYSVKVFQVMWDLSRFVVEYLPVAAEGVR